MDIRVFIRKICFVVSIYFACFKWAESCSCHNATREEKFCESDYICICINITYRNEYKTPRFCKISSFTGLEATMDIRVFIRKICFVVSIYFACFKWAESCSCRNATREEKFCESDYTVIGRLIGRFVTPGIPNNIYVIQVQFHIKGSGPKYIELESPMSTANCGTVLDVGQDYLLAGKIKSGIRGELSSCSWHEKWTECPFLVRWRLLQKQVTCKNQQIQGHYSHASVSQNTVYPNLQTQMHRPALQRPMPTQEDPPMYRISHPETMYHISHPGNHIYSQHHQHLGYMGGRGMGNHLEMSDPQEQMDYVGGHRGMTMFGYRHRGGTDMYSHLRESSD